MNLRFRLGWWNKQSWMEHNEMKWNGTKIWLHCLNILLWNDTNLPLHCLGKVWIILLINEFHSIAYTPKLGGKGKLHMRVVLDEMGSIMPNFIPWFFFYIKSNNGILMHTTQFQFIPSHTTIQIFVWFHFISLWLKCIFYPLIFIFIFKKKF